MFRALAVALAPGRRLDEDVAVQKHLRAYNVSGIRGGSQKALQLRRPWQRLVRLLKHHPDTMHVPEAVVALLLRNPRAGVVCLFVWAFHGPPLLPLVAPVGATVVRMYVSHATRYSCVHASYCACSTDELPVCPRGQGGGLKIHCR